MAVNADEDTEFNDALRKHGILPPREPPPRTPSPPPSPSLDDLLDDLTTSELRDLEEDAWDDDTQRIVEQHKRQRRLQEQEKLRTARFGRVYPIARDDYTREVTEASKASEESDKKEKGTGVVCFLYKDGVPRSDRAFQHIRMLAERHPHTKFVSIVGDKCIPNLPESRIPMIIIYKNGEIQNQITAWGSDRERRIEELEAVLVVSGALEPEKRPESRSDDEEDRSRTTRKKDDSDSDFEFDL
ncbi:thioredoxin-like protein [Amanita muscaria]